MFVNGCHLDLKLCDENPEGFSVVVSRSRVTGLVKDTSGKLVEAIETVKRGPFAVIRDAQIYAHTWSDFDNPPPIPEPEKKPETEPNSTENKEAE